jgi:cytochrome b561
MTTNRYPAVSIILHWAMLLLIAATYAAIQLRELFPGAATCAPASRPGISCWD